jgi:hypothetical protein
MSPSSLAQLFKENPHQPYRLTLSSGDTILVDNPGRVVVVELEAYVGQSEDPDALLGQRMRIVSVPNITMVEPVDRNSVFFRPTRRRRRK